MTQESAGALPPRVLAITASAPHTAANEVFVQEELEEMASSGLDLVVVPMRRELAAANAAARASGLARNTRAQRLGSLRVLAGALAMLAHRPVRSLRAIVMALAASNGQRNLAVNILSSPKALWIARLVLSNRVTHIHAYWLGHTATAAMIASEVSGVPFSVTAYRWDIDAANALGRKLRSATFVRCADELGLSRLREAAAELVGNCSIVMVRTGVLLPGADAWASRPLHLTELCCPAMFVEKKGHAVLLPAFRQMLDVYPSARLRLFGSGTGEDALRRKTDELGLLGAVTFHGLLSLPELRRYLRTERPVCVLPSIRAADGQEEGIPVTLVEAMANGAPVLSTRSGSIENLVLKGCGVLVEPNDVQALAEALIAIPRDPDGAARRCREAENRLAGEYDLAHTAARMAALMGARADVQARPL